VPLFLHLSARLNDIQVSRGARILPFPSPSPFVWIQSRPYLLLQLPFPTSELDGSSPKASHALRLKTPKGLQTSTCELSTYSTIFPPRYAYLFGHCIGIGLSSPFSLPGTGCKKPNSSSPDPLCSLAQEAFLPNVPSSCGPPISLFPFFCYLEKSWYSFLRQGGYGFW